MLHSSYNWNQQSQWSRVQTRRYRDEKSHRVSPRENNIFVFCSHTESHKNMSDSIVCWRKTNSLRTNKQLVLKRLNIYIYFFEGTAVQASHSIHNRTSQLYRTILMWNSSREQYLEVQTCNREFLGKTKKLGQKNQTESWHHWRTTEKSEDLQRRHLLTLRFCNPRAAFQLLWGGLQLQLHRQMPGPQHGTIFIWWDSWMSDYVFITHDFI